MATLPRDVELKLISLMDIDARRALGIYSKMKVPQGLHDEITNSLMKLNISKDYAFVRLGEERPVNIEATYSESMYVITRSKLWDDEANRCTSLSYDVYIVEYVDKLLNGSNDYYSMHTISSYDTPEMDDWPYVLPLSSIGA
jgi:hypothetical protein